MALNVEEGSARLASAAAVLRELVHQHAGRLALEPRLEVKGLLAVHLHDDALGVTALRGRLAELGRPEEPGERAPEIRADGAQAYLDAAYGHVKPRLAAALREHLEALDPVADEPGLRLLVELLHRQERHVAELPAGAGRGAGAGDDGGAARGSGAGDGPLRAGPYVATGPAGDDDAGGGLAVLPPVEVPARDAYLVMGAEQDGLHARMHWAVCFAELAGRTLHEQPDRPWALHADLARLSWDGMRHAAVLDRAMTDAGARWGSEPVDVRPFAAASRLDLAGRLAALAVAAEAAGEPPSGVAPAAAEHLRADAAYHVRVCARWGRQVLENDGGAWYARIRAARARAATAALAV